ncbi:fibronectin type III domain protein [Paenibacillus prosopidis]|uniref:Fibronectin type III domain protein n=1 Tax=Paenibacillus prosopidis TaxID=630520 RepID=A0A368VIM9_9BACL|nr:fibronectin type III domain protein [Paenibacillus prosopidis]
MRWLAIVDSGVGQRPGKEVVQLYVAPQNSSIIRPIRELKDFAKFHLKVGETNQVIFRLSSRAYAYFNITTKDFIVETGTYEIQIGRSSRYIVLTEKAEVIGKKY